MIKFLLQRPISVFMVFLACVIIGIITSVTLPVSLLPNIAIPEMTVQVSGTNMSARELENMVVQPLRRQLMQVSRLRDIRSETRNESGIIRLKFDYGTDTDLAFIEVNEKIDGGMNYLPREINRPLVIKASATDLPVFYINITSAQDRPYEATNEAQFLDLSEFADQVVKRRFEQLPEVAMVDMTGLMYKHVQIVPDFHLLASAGITLDELERVLNANNVEPGSMVVRDGYYEYNIKFSSLLRTVEDIREIYLKKGERLFQLKELAKIDVVPQQVTGLSMINGEQTVTLAVIKQADETMQHLKVAVEQTLADLRQHHPELQFTVNRNQTELLDYTIANLRQNLLLGFLLVFIVTLLFLGDAKSPLVIGISMLTALATSFIFFYLFGQSLNIISLSGMILALGMMIDSSIIVTDIITQYRDQGFSLEEACIRGTNEVITPILSSTLTTVAVFVPLVFMSGIAGAIFFDQAFAVTVGLFVSYLTGIILLPVLYREIYGRRFFKRDVKSLTQGLQQFTDRHLFSWYDRGFQAVFRHKWVILLAALITLPLTFWLFSVMPKSNMPHLEHHEMTVMVDWNEHLHVDENRRRVDEVLRLSEPYASENACYIGHQQYLLEKTNDLTASEAQLYFKASHPRAIDSLQTMLTTWMHAHYPTALITFAPPENIFEKIFVTGEADVVAELIPQRTQERVDPAAVKAMCQQLTTATGVEADVVAFDEELVVTVDREQLLLYGISYEEVYSTLKTSFRHHHIATLRSFLQYLPISLSGRQQRVNEILQETLIQTKGARGEALSVSLQSLVKVHRAEDLKRVVAGRSGEFIPVAFHDVAQPERLIEQVEQEVRQTDQWEVSFSGGFFSARQMLDELVVILLVSLLLMYFILASQFESFLQPLIVLIEIPIDVAFALLLLWLSGHTLNLMSAIGIVVACGIIINDSILKIDMINELRKEGVPLMEAIHTAGVKRLRAIVMTSLTTILAMVPLLFSFDIGSELQKPLSIAMISTMLIGTLVSLYVIPLVYWLIYRKKALSDTVEGTPLTKETE